MKLSLKYRISLVFLLVMALYTLSILLYYRMVVMEQTAVDIRNFREHYTVENAAMTEYAGLLWEDKGLLRSRLEEDSRRNGISVKVYDLAGEEVFRFDHAANGIWTFAAKEVVKRDGKAVAFIEIRYPIKARDIVSHFHSIASLLKVSLTAMAAAVLFLVFYIHFVVVKPLLGLHGSMKQATLGNMKPPAGEGRKDEIGELMANFRGMGERLEQSHRDQNDMIAAISHDLRTPLTSIIGYVERLESGKIKSESQLRDYYGVIRQKAKDMERLIGDFAVFSRNEAEASSPRKEQLELSGFFQALFLEYGMELEANHALFSCEADLPAGRCAVLDPKGLRRIVANLVDNAMAYGHAPVRIHMSAKLADHALEFAVEDNGPGVEEKERERIFRKFYRVDPSRSRGSGGTGLGLAICMSIAEAHGGTMEAFGSRLGGLGIRVRLPV